MEPDAGGGGLRRAELDGRHGEWRSGSTYQLSALCSGTMVRLIDAALLQERVQTEDSSSAVSSQHSLHFAQVDDDRMRADAARPIGSHYYTEGRSPSMGSPRW